MELFKLLVCPVSKQSLRYDEATKVMASVAFWAGHVLVNLISCKQELISDAAGLSFPVVDGIANLVPSSARKLSSSQPDSGSSS